MSKCNAPGCTTNENTQINGKNLTLFSFPKYDDSLFKQWEENSRISENKSDIKLCELHFESDSFASEERNALAPGAVPTIFEFNNKRRIEDVEDKPYERPLKQKKIEENGQPSTSVKLEGDSPIQLKSEAIIDETEKRLKNISDEKRTDIGSSVFTKQIDMGKKVYRLLIRIDKVTNKKDVIKDTNTISIEKKSEIIKLSKLPLHDMKTSNNSSCSNLIKRCTKRGCNLIKTTLNSKPVFKCERCDKYYVVKEKNIEESDKTIIKNNLMCYICDETFSTTDSLNVHTIKHFTCDMCQAQCSTRISYDKHLRLHVSTDPLYPYKCHKCANTFEVKADVRQHYAEEHSKNFKQDNDNIINIKKRSLSNTNKVLYRCAHCHMVFKQEQSYKSHVTLHMGNGNFDCALCNKRFKTATHLAIHQSKHLGSLKFDCQICGKSFSSLENVDEHMKTHTEIIRDEKQHNCNICDEIFDNESTLNSHIREHLSRAHRCPKCNKAFINKTTLNIHFKTHNKGTTTMTTNRIDKDTIPKKRSHECTLCSSKFDSRSKLYNHIMTHLEQMHGGEGGDVVFDGLNELLETDEDILS